MEHFAEEPFVLNAKRLVGRQQKRSTARQEKTKDMAKKQRRNQEGTLFYDRVRKRYRAQIRFGGKRKAVYGKTEKECLAKLAEERDRAAQNLAPSDGRYKVKAYFEHWLEVKKADLKPSTVYWYEKLFHHLKPIENRAVKSITVVDVEAVLAAVDLSWSRRKAVLGLMRQLFKSAHRQGLTVSNPALLVPTPKKQGVKEADPLDASEAQQFLAAIDDTRDRALFTLALHTGMRLGEILGLLWEDVGSRSLEVRHSLATVDGSLVLQAPKTAKARRTVPLSASVREALASHRKEQSSQRLASGNWTDPLGKLVFPRRKGTGEPMQPTDVRYSLRKALDAAGLPMIRFHDLRHTCGTLMIEAGVDPSTVSTQLGHSTVGFTLSTYVHPDLSSQERAADALAGLLS